MSWLRRRDDGAGRVRGRPPSGNGASSMHLWWDVPDGPWVEAEAVLEVVDAPAVRDLHFWALQVSFLDGDRPVGAAHTGLQWNPSAPAGAVNWGGYAEAGGELSGTASALPAVDRGPNTRQWRWQPGHLHKLHVHRVGLGTWRATVTDLTEGRSAVIRDLHADADRLGSPVVWSEVFADCGAPSTAVRWSRLALRDARGGTARAAAVSVSYQAPGDGGCDNTDASVDDAGVVQRTAALRRTPAGARLRLPQS